MSEEQYCYQKLAELRESYERDAKPYIDRLAAIQRMRLTPRIMLTSDQARGFVGIAMSAHEGARCAPLGVARHVAQG